MVLLNNTNANAAKRKKAPPGPSAWSSSVRGQMITSLDTDTCSHRSFSMDTILRVGEGGTSVV